MKIKSFFAIVVIIVAATACSNLKRHASAGYAGADSSLANIDIFGYRVYDKDELSPPGNLWDLNATAQANLLEILDRRFPGNNSFINALNNRYYTGSEATKNKSYTDKNLRLVLTVSRKRDYKSVSRNKNTGHPAADRIEYLKIRLSLPGDIALEFTNWNRFTTDYADIEVGDVSFNRTIDLNAEAGISEGNNVERNAGTGIKGSISRDEEQQIKYRYMKMNGRLSKKCIEIEEEGNREIDLTGNIISDVSLQFSTFTEKVFIPVFDNNEGDRKKTSVSLLETNIEVPAVAGSPLPVNAMLEMDFVYRHVKAGSETFQEWDDVVDYYTGSVKKEIQLLGVHDYVPEFYCIGIQSPSKNLIRVNKDDKKSYVLKFRNYSEASSFYSFLISLKQGEENPEEKINDYSLFLAKDQELTRDMIDRLVVMPYYDTMN
ncbi:MAG: hypothetical protein K9J25_13640 [Bacteroidales bacterium]|nr:hypothetical protein [Bacteroidales bacterium]